MTTPRNEQGQATLSIERCPSHGYMAVCVNVGDVGTRVTPSKCCGRWDTVKAWSLSAREWRRLADEAEAMADALEEDPTR